MSTDASSPPPAKRQRRADVSSGVDAAAPASQPPAFRLTRLRGAPDAHNRTRGVCFAAFCQLWDLGGGRNRVVTLLLSLADDAVGLRELLDGAFESVLLGNYMVDVDWLLGECPRLRDVPVVLVHGERDRGAMTTACRSLANVTLVAPPLPIAYGTHHTKMMVRLSMEVGRR